MPDNIEIELELTYLACEIPKELKGATPRKLLDIYIPENADRPFIRLRQKDQRYEITKKRPIDDEDASRQTEQTIPLDQVEFAALSIASQRRVEKDRYEVNIEGHRAEVDIFQGELAGLVLIDFEFETLAGMQAFRPPECCSADVTQERFLAGGQLAGKSYADIEADLKRCNYKRLAL
jgi:CYTH domain-containing protein